MTHLSLRMDKHPYECGGATGGCVHCQKIVSDDHDPKDCLFCEADWLDRIPRKMRAIVGMTYDEIRDGVLLIVLASVNWHRGRAAAALGIPGRTLSRWIAAYEDAVGAPMPRRVSNLPGPRSAAAEQRRREVMDRLRPLNEGETL